jgi:hypothetical protein
MEGFDIGTAFGIKVKKRLLTFKGAGWFIGFGWGAVRILCAMFVFSGGSMGVGWFRWWVIGPSRGNPQALQAQQDG